MSNNYKDPAFKKWLNILQQESWQLELIISGFAIYGLIIVLEPLRLSWIISQNEQHLYQLVFSVIGLVACYILIINLLVHVVLRGLWIGALGLRYLSGDIDYEQLNYSSKFTSYLKKRIGSFDKYIATLEDYCSVLFALSFLLIFYFLGIVLSFFSLVAAAVYLIDDDGLLGGALSSVGIVLVLFIMLGMILTFIDFVGQGILKKKKWISKIYFPIYWVFSFVTLSFLYRPLVYNFLDNKFGKRILIMLIPIYSLIIFISSLYYQNSNYLSDEKPSSIIYANIHNYDDLLIEDDDFVNVASIPSKVINDSYLKVFVIYSEEIEDYIFNFNEGLKPKNDYRGLRSNINFNGDSNNSFFRTKNKDSLNREYLKTFKETYFISIDSLNYNTDFIVTLNKKEQLGFETFINIKSLAEGKHLLKIKRLYIRKKDTIKSIKGTIPFWYYKN